MSQKLIVPAGTKFKSGAVAIEEITKPGCPRRFIVRCKCGVKYEAALMWAVNAKHGCKNCGRNGTALNSRSHGMTGSRIYHIWKCMNQRCYNPANKKFKDYGGRGIRVSDKWKNSFDSFYADMGERPEGMSLDRKDNNGNYCKENCRWASSFQQARNARSNILITVNGVTVTATEAAIRFGLKPLTVIDRFHKGWPIEKILSPLNFAYGKAGQILQP